MVLSGVSGTARYIRLVNRSISDGEVALLFGELDVQCAITSNITCEGLLAMYRTMLRIRIFEEKAADCVETGEILCPVHLYIGQEAVATGVCAALADSDYVWGNHRSHGHYLAKGGDMNALMAELFCRRDGCARGRGGSMHIYAQDVGILGTVPMVAATIPIAVGAALSAAMRGTGQVSVAFFGDGATEEGVFHESVNFAALHRLPVIFVCENTCIPVTSLSARGPSEICTFTQSLMYPGIFGVDGNDVVAVYEAAAEAVSRARQGQGPTLLECMTYRWRGHVGPHYDLDRGIRTKEELDDWVDRCPIQLLERTLLQAGVATADGLQAIRDEVEGEVTASLEYARRSPYPGVHEVEQHVFVDRK